MGFEGFVGDTESPAERETGADGDYETGRAELIDGCSIYSFD